MQTMNQNNKSMSYLLSRTAEEADNTSALYQRVQKELRDIASMKYAGAISYDEMREATREQLSITQDMRRNSIKRLVDEIEGKMREIASEHFSYSMRQGFERNIEQMLQYYIDLGVIRVTRTEVATGGWGEYLKYTVTIEPLLTGETVDITVSMYV